MKSKGQHDKIHYLNIEGFRREGGGVRQPINEKLNKMCGS